MDKYEIDGMTVDQMFYWFDQPAVYLGRVTGGDARPCLVLLVSDSDGSTIYHRLRFETERGMRATLAAGVAATPATYAMAQDLARLVATEEGGEWTATSYEEIVALDGRGTALPPGRSSGDIPMDNWSDDHWRLLVLMADVHLATAEGGIPVMDYDRMRINPSSHIVHCATCDADQANRAWNAYGGTMTRRPSSDVDTERRPGEVDWRISYHDDFDCVEELEAEGMLDILSTAKGEYKMTVRGLDMADRLRSHVATGRPIRDFDAGQDDMRKAEIGSDRK